MNLEQARQAVLALAEQITEDRTHTESSSERCRQRSGDEVNESVEKEVFVHLLK